MSTIPKYDISLPITKTGQDRSFVLAEYSFAPWHARSKLLCMLLAIERSNTSPYSAKVKDWGYPVLYFGGVWRSRTADLGNANAAL